MGSLVLGGFGGPQRIPRLISALVPVPSDRLKNAVDWLPGRFDFKVGSEGYFRLAHPIDRLFCHLFSSAHLLSSQLFISSSPHISRVEPRSYSPLQSSALTKLATTENPLTIWGKSFMIDFKFQAQDGLWLVAQISSRHSLRSLPKQIL